MKKVFLILFLIILFLFLYYSGKKYVKAQIFSPKGEKGRYVFAEIKPGMGLKDSALLLQKKGIIKSRTFFLLGYKIFFKGKTIKAGEYRFEFPISIHEVLRKITQGEIYLHPITIPEGSTIEDIADILENEGILKGNDFKKTCERTEIISTIDREAQNLEGFLFPDTYFLPKGIKPERVVEIMVSRFKEKVDKYVKMAEKKGLNFYRILILASLIEKETGVPSEKPLVSSVFHNRLKRGMLLQCDPTVIYALKKEGIYQYPLKKEDLSFPSPYNTYIHKGLPPGPICNPGIDSIDSALNPAKTDFLYFVSNGDGTHTFSSDLPSHNRAVRNYRKQILENRR